MADAVCAAAAWAKFSFELTSGRARKTEEGASPNGAAKANGRVAAQLCASPKPGPSAQLKPVSHNASLCAAAFSEPSMRLSMPSSSWVLPIKAKRMFFAAVCPAATALRPALISSSFCSKGA